MKHLFLFFSLQCAVALSQVSTIDSLELIINAPENDSVLCHAIFSKGRIMEKSNPTEALALYERSLHLAQNNEFQQLEVLSLNYLGVLCYNIGADDQACAYYKAVIERTNQYNDFLNVNSSSSCMGSASMYRGSLPKATQNFILETTNRFGNYYLKVLLLN